ncbi:hypothetical protein ACFUN7_19310 [Streptomyces sp. NPDC057236]|uniref:hypothetical protein n=1 Tax=Streptomyces sp. NPDC057236 TaxID=3346059 RepID=UPI003641D4BC
MPELPDSTSYDRVGLATRPFRLLGHRPVRNVDGLLPAVGAHRAGFARYGPDSPEAAERLGLDRLAGAGTEPVGGPGG